MAGFIDGVESPHLLVDVAAGLGADSARDKRRRMLQTVKHDLYRAGRKSGMAEWRNSGMAEWRNSGIAEWRNRCMPPTRNRK